MRYNHIQCFFFSRNTAQVTPKNIYFYYLEIYLQDQSITYMIYKKINKLILKKETLVTSRNNEPFGSTKCVHYSKDPFQRRFIYPDLTVSGVQKAYVVQKIRCCMARYSEIHLYNEVVVCSRAAHSQPVLPCLPKYCLGHPENYLFLLSKNVFIGSKYPKNKLINFERKLLATPASQQASHIIQRHFTALKFGKRLQTRTLQSQRNCGSADASGK